jgi:hypothetical protein
MQPAQRPEDLVSRKEVPVAHRESKKQDVRRSPQTSRRFSVVKLEERIAPGQSHFPPGQFPGGNPANAGGASNNPGNSK